MKYTLLAFATLFYMSVLGQNSYTSKKDISDIKEIIFYGYDFSNFKLADGKRFSDEKIKKYIPAWISFLTGKMNETYFAKRLKTNKVIFDFEFTTKLIKELDEQTLVSLIKNHINIDSLQGIINNYETTRKEGIGFSIIVECFDKSTNRSSAYFTFFDIATKKIIMTDYFSTNHASGAGLSKYWGRGFYITVDSYISDEFKSSLRKK
ncbi:MAG: hypothetical protein WBP16_03460 [Ferruginibacter sp.]